MKTLLNILLVIFFFAMMAVAFTSCEEIVYKDVIKYVDRPVPTSLAPTFITVYDTIETVRTDTVEVKVIIHETDTLIQYATKDSLVIQTVEKVVHHTDSIIIHDVDTVWLTVHDTVTLTEYEQTVVYLATTYLFPGQSVFFVPEPLMPYYRSFIADAQARGKSPTGGDLIVQYVKSEDIAGENWVSSSVQMSGWQNVIYLDEGLLPEHSKAALYRELSRLELKKKYSNDVTKVNCPLFRTSPEPTTNEINILFN